MHELLLALPLGLLVGLSLGALGAGGSILTVPALVLLLGQTPHQAAAASLIVVGVTATSAAVGHHRRGSVRLRAGLAFALPGIAGSIIASDASLRTNPDVLALAFAGIMLVAAAAVWRSAARASNSTAATDAPTHRITRTIIAGVAVGLLTGYFGIGGGFLAVPALTWALGVSMTTAVGTSLLVIALNAAAALMPRLASGLVDPWLTLVFVVGGVLGGTVGTAIAHRTDPSTLKRAFAIVVVLMAIALAADTQLG